MTLTRTESFVLLTPASPHPASERREFRATVISQSSQSQTFQSVAAAAVSSIANPTAHVSNCEPKISLQRDGNRVTGIHIECSCGQVIDLSCVYDVTAPQITATTQSIADPAEPQDGGAPRSATIPQSEPTKPAPGKICKDSGKDLPKSGGKKPKEAEKGRGTSAAKRRSA